MKPDSYYEERFWQNVDKSGECWLWTGKLTAKGYGSFTARREGDSYWKAHRFSYHLHYGRIPDGLVICHKCDMTACANPAHLKAATTQENTREREKRGKACVGEGNGNSRLKEKDVERIYRQMRSGANGMTLARVYGVHNSVIYNILSGKKWSHVTGQKYEKKGIRYVDDGDRQRMHELRASGLTYKQIANEVGWSEPTVYRVARTAKTGDNDVE